MALVVKPDGTISSTGLEQQREEQEKRAAAVAAIDRRLHEARMAMGEVCRKLARLKSGPTKAKQSEWIGKVLALAEEARAALAIEKGG